MTFQALNFNSVTALSFQLMLGSMRYSGALQPTAVQHSPGEPCVKPLDVFSLPIQHPVARQHPRILALAHARILDARHGVHHAGVATGVINVYFIQWCGVKGAGVDKYVCYQA